MICDLCGQDRLREDTWILAFLRRGWPPVRFARVCPGCRYRMGRRKATYHRAFFLLCCLALVAVVSGCGIGIVYLVQWLINLGST